MCGVAALFLSSCTVYKSWDVTGNPMGKKEGKTTKFMSFINSQNYGVTAAAEKAKIKKIGAVETTVKMFLFVPVETVTVYGE